MDRDRIRTAIADTRRGIADVLDNLDGEQLATPSLCDGWDVKTVGAHLVSILTEGTFKVALLSWRRRSADRAIDEMARRTAQLPATEIAANLRALADHSYWRPPPQAAGLLAEVLCHSGDIRIPLGLPFEAEPYLIARALDFLTCPAPIGMVPLGRLRGIRLVAYDIDRTWGDGCEIRGQAVDLMMAAVGRTSALSSLDGPGVPLLRRRISGSM
jgi:uncharacterized protein (TIGR03083 family)